MEMDMEKLLESADEDKDGQINEWEAYENQDAVLRFAAHEDL